ncbi:MAG TPA: amino acid ABC transporter substrate-binding protein [Ktedonobacteraceae bacterium]|nr:amino acid ABC transporter substrate-binding protein [Ktedonobacteraceae bacterium]
MFKARRVRSSGWLSIVSCMVMMLAGLSACAQDQTSSTGGSTAFTNSKPIVIGFSMPLTKDFSTDGQLMLQGYQLWADAVNNSGGILGRPVQLKHYDDQSDPDKTKSNYETLINKDKVDLLFGPFSTLLTKAAEGANGISAYPFVEGAGGAPSVFSDPADGRPGGWPNLFAVSVPVVNNLDTYAYYILSLPLSQRPKTIAYLTSDDPFTFPQIDRAEQLLWQGGVKTVFPTPANFKQFGSMPQFSYGPQESGPQYEYGEGDKNPTAEATAYAEAVVHANPDVVVLGTLLPDIQAEIAVFKKEHFKPKSLIATAGPDLGSDFIHAIGGEQYTEGIFVPNGWYPQANNFQNAAMVQAYIAKYGGTANQVNADVAEAYSVGQVTQQAIEKVGSLDKTALKNELHSGDAFNTVQGTASFASDGRNTQGLAYLFQWQGGQLIPVYPLSVAAENPEYDKYGF